jgi:hypothetical protein
MSRICYGEFDWRDGNSTQAYMRNLFTKAVSEHASEVADELHSKCFPLYRELVDKCGRWVEPLETEGCAVSKRYQTLSAIDIFYLSDECAVGSQQLLKSVNSSLKNWNLCKRWILEITLDTLQLWSHFSKRPKRLPFSSTGFGGFKPQTPEPPEGCPPYDPLAMLREWYLESVRASALKTMIDDPILRHGKPSHRRAFVDTIQTAVSKYCDEVEKCHEIPAFRRRTSNEKRNLTQHLEWSVRYQVNRDTLAEIAKAAGVNNPSSVSRAVDNILCQIGLEKRSDARPGRTRGSRNQTSPILRSLGR